MFVDNCERNEEYYYPWLPVFLLLLLCYSLNGSPRSLFPLLSFMIVAVKILYPAFKWALFSKTEASHLKKSATCLLAEGARNILNSVDSCESSEFPNVSTLRTLRSAVRTLMEANNRGMPPFDYGQLNKSCERNTSKFSEIAKNNRDGSRNFIGLPINLKTTSKLLPV